MYFYQGAKTMEQWHIKELSELTNVSVRTLHHYDHVGLLKPSVRSANGYRWYTQRDLVTLQQIIALKFFGFGLSQIKTMLQHQPGILEHLQTQEQMFKEQLAHLAHAQETMATLIARFKQTGSLDWKDLISLIERYRMNEELKKTWMGTALDDAGRAEYIALREQNPKEFALWEKTIVEINQMQLGDPEGPDGERVVKIFYDLVRKTKKSWTQQRKFNAGVVRKIKSGQMSELPLTPEGNLWLAKASLAYWLKRWDHVYEEISKNLKQDPAGAIGKKIAKMWRELINDHFMGASPDLAMGAMIWQEEARQQAELAELVTPPTPQEVIKKVRVKFLLDPDAFNWIEAALESH